MDNLRASAPNLTTPNREVVGGGHPVIEPQPRHDVPPPQEGPPPLPVDVAVPQQGIANLVTASQQQVNLFMTAHTNQVPDSIQVADGDLVIRFGNEMLRATPVSLAGTVATGGAAHGTALGRALLVFEAASQANLPDSAIRTIVSQFRLAVSEGTSPQMAMQNAFSQVAMAAMVESYVQNKDGLATDIRRVASYVEDASSTQGAGGSGTARANRTVRREQIANQQRQLDQALMAVTSGLTEARIGGDYATAFDRLQQFFQTCSQVTETVHWRLRASDPASACPPLAERPGALRGGTLLKAALEQGPQSRTFTGTQVARASGVRRALDKFRAAFVAFGQAITFRTKRPGPIPGLVGVAEARKFVQSHGNVTAQGVLAAPIDQVKTDDERVVATAFGAHTRSWVRKAAAEGTTSELVALAKAAVAHPGLQGDALVKLLEGRSLTAVRHVVEALVTIGPQPINAVRSWVDRFAHTPEMGEAFAAAMPLARITRGTPVTEGDLDALVTHGLKKQTEKPHLFPTIASALREDARTIMLNALNRKDDHTRPDMLVKLRDPQVLERLRNLPSKLEGPIRMALALREGPADDEVAIERAKRLNAVLEGPPPVIGNWFGTVDMAAMLHPDVTQQQFDMAMTLLPSVPRLLKQVVDRNVGQRLRSLATEVVALHRGQPTPEAIARTTETVYLLKNVSTATMAHLMFSDESSLKPPGDRPFVPVTRPTVDVPPTEADLGRFEPTDQSGGQTISLTRWWKTPEGDRRMVKVPPPHEAFVPALERQVAVLAKQLGLNCNEVQIKPVGPTAERMGVTDQVGPEVRYASVHTPVGRHCVEVTQAWTMMGLNPKDCDFRRWDGTEVTSVGNGASSFLQPGGGDFIESLRQGIEMVTLDNGSRQRASDPIPEGRVVTDRHTYRVANPELLDQVVAFDHLIANSDRHEGNLLLSSEEQNGTTTFTVHLIDHGRAFHSGKVWNDMGDATVYPDNWVEGRHEQLKGYLLALKLPENATHAANVRGTLEAFANLSDEQLLEHPLAGVPQDAYKPEDKNLHAQWLQQARATVRDYLAANPV